MVEVTPTGGGLRWPMTVSEVSEPDAGVRRV
jgi:hypothetical protein